MGRVTRYEPERLSRFNSRGALNFMPRSLGLSCEHVEVTAIFKQGYNAILDLE